MNSLISGIGAPEELDFGGAHEKEYGNFTPLHISISRGEVFLSLSLSPPPKQRQLVEVEDLRLIMHAFFFV